VEEEEGEEVGEEGMTDPIDPVYEVRDEIVALTDELLDVCDRSKCNALVISYASLGAFLKTLECCGFSLKQAKRIFGALEELYKKLLEMKDADESRIAQLKEKHGKENS